MTNHRDSTGGQHGRDEIGRWLPGQSGNPNGRPKGARHKATMAAEALLDGAAERLSLKAIELAMDGDTTAMRLCLERILPPRKERPVGARLPQVTNSSELVTVTAALLASAACGELTPGEAGDLAKLVEAHRKTIETIELEQRISRLEEHAGGKAA